MTDVAFSPAIEAPHDRKIRLPRQGAGELICIKRLGRVNRMWNRAIRLPSLMIGVSSR
jgi:hypothetical protein